MPKQYLARVEKKTHPGVSPSEYQKLGGGEETVKEGAQFWKNAQNKGLGEILPLDAMKEICRISASLGELYSYCWRNIESLFTKNTARGYHTVLPYYSFKALTKLLLILHHFIYMFDF